MAVILRRKVGRQPTIVTVAAADTVILRGTQGPGEAGGTSGTCSQ